MNELASDLANHLTIGPRKGCQTPPLPCRPQTVPTNGPLPGAESPLAQHRPSNLPLSTRPTAANGKTPTPHKMCTAPTKPSLVLKPKNPRPSATKPSLTFIEPAHQRSSSRESPSQQQAQRNEELERRFHEIERFSGVLTINGRTYKCARLSQDFRFEGDLGSGSCGRVTKHTHLESGCPMAVKQMNRPRDLRNEETKRIFMDLDVIRKSHDCRYIVQCYGYLIAVDAVHIFMEQMSTCLDKLLKRTHQPIPEAIIGKITVAVINALHYLKEKHNIMHRDVKPSNILINDRGEVKLCDFGISGKLVDSYAKTGGGCPGYMSPERISPPDFSKQHYDIRADVWSYGITMIELATAKFPYEGCKGDFEVMSKIVDEAPPKLPVNGKFSNDFRQFVDACLVKNVHQRPKYPALLSMPFIQTYEKVPVDLEAWYRCLSTDLQRNN